MKTNYLLALVFCTGLLVLSGASFAQEELSAKDLVDRADQNREGDSSISEMKMTIVRPTWERTLEFKNWIKGDNYALTLVTAPAKEKGQTFLKRHNDMWNYLPKISRMIKLPPSMMGQGWMGSDYTNDDVMNETSLITDFSHRKVGQNEIEGRICEELELIPNEDAEVVWGKIIVWISQQDFLFLKFEYYDEDGYLVRTERGGDIQKMDDRIIPTRFEIIPADDPGQKTIVKIVQMDFDVDIPDSFFSQQNMKRIR